MEHEDIVVSFNGTLKFIVTTFARTHSTVGHSIANVEHFLSRFNDEPGYQPNIEEVFSPELWEKACPGPNESGKFKISFHRYCLSRKMCRRHVRDTLKAEILKDYTEPTDSLTRNETNLHIDESKNAAVNYTNKIIGNKRKKPAPSPSNTILNHLVSRETYRIPIGRNPYTTTR